MEGQAQAKEGLLLASCQAPLSGINHSYERQAFYKARLPVSAVCICKADPSRSTCQSWDADLLLALGKSTIVKLAILIAQGCLHMR